MNRVKFERGLSAAYLAGPLAVATQGVTCRATAELSAQNRKPSRHEAQI
jgi:hypothetical protein